MTIDATFWVMISFFLFVGLFHIIVFIAGTKITGLLEASKVVEYERPDKTDENIEKDRSHLTNKNFVDAMALLSEDINE